MANIVTVTSRFLPPSFLPPIFILDSLSCGHLDEGLSRIAVVGAAGTRRYLRMDAIYLYVVVLFATMATAGWMVA